MAEIGMGDIKILCVNIKVRESIKKNVTRMT